MMVKWRPSPGSSSEGFHGEDVLLSPSLIFLRLLHLVFKLGSVFLLAGIILICLAACLLSVGGPGPAGEDGAPGSPGLPAPPGRPGHLGGQGLPGSQLRLLNQFSLINKCMFFSDKHKTCFVSVGPQGPKGGKGDQGIGEAGDIGPPGGPGNLQHPGSKRRDGHGNPGDCQPSSRFQLKGLSISGLWDISSFNCVLGP